MSSSKSKYFSNLFFPLGLASQTTYKAIQSKVYTHRLYSIIYTIMESTITNFIIILIFLLHILCHTWFILSWKPFCLLFFSPSKSPSTQLLIHLNHALTHSASWGAYKDSEFYYYINHWLSVMFVGATYHNRRMTQDSKNSAMFHHSAIAWHH